MGGWTAGWSSAKNEPSLQWLSPPDSSSWDVSGLGYSSGALKHNTQNCSGPPIDYGVWVLPNFGTTRSRHVATPHCPRPPAHCTYHTTSICVCMQLLDMAQENTQGCTVYDTLVHPFPLVARLRVPSRRTHAKNCGPCGETTVAPFLPAQTSCPPCRLFCAEPELAGSMSRVQPNMIEIARM